MRPAGSPPIGRPRGADVTGINVAGSNVAGCDDAANDTKHAAAGIGQWIGITLSALLLIVSGCERLTTDYGRSKGRVGRVSLNGFGALRKSFEHAGFECRDITRLSNRVSRSDVIVWTPQQWGPTDAQATGWFDRWLGSGGKTLLYVVPDSGSEADYWAAAARIGPPDQKLEYRRRHAESINQRIVWRMNRTEVEGSGWFDIVPFRDRVEVDLDRASFLSQPSAGADEPTSRVSIEMVIEARPADVDPAVAGQTTWFNAPQTGPNPVVYPAMIDPQPTTVPVTSRPLIATADGATVIAEITSDQWPASRILVVGGGSLLTNFAFTRPANRRLAAGLIRRATPVTAPGTTQPGTTQPRAAFLNSQWSTVPVSDREPSVPQASGMELLTTWPISLVTMHGVFLVLIVCLTLFPVFGRPRRVRHHRQSSFGDHLDAVAALMNRTSGKEYARSRLQEYRKRIHGEHPPATDNPSATASEASR